MQQDHWLSITRYCEKLESPEKIGRHAAQRALRRLGARKVKTCEVPVVFEPLAARTLVKHVFDAVSGDAIYRKRSFLDGQLGEQVAGKSLTIVDDARLFGGLGSSPFDDEGVGTRLTAVVEDGNLPIPIIDPEGIALSQLNLHLVSDPESANESFAGTVARIRANLTARGFIAKP